MNYGVLFQHLRWHLFRNNLRTVLERSRARLATILVCCLVIWGSIFTLSYLGLREISGRYRVPLDGEIMEQVFGLMFLVLGTLLIFSTGIILFASLFGTQETHFLLCSPVPADHVFAYKFQGAVAFSSWAFVLLGSPVLIAFGLNLQPAAAWYFYAVLPLFFLGFVVVPGAVGALLCLAIVNIVPRRRKQLVLLLIGLFVGAVLFTGWSWAQSLRSLVFGTRDWFSTMLNDLSLLNAPWMPSRWIAAGLHAAAIGASERMAFFLAMIWSNALFLYLVVVVLAKYLYRRSYNRLASGSSIRRKYGGMWIDRIVDLLLFGINPQTRQLIIKDFRTFRRDPAQWFQITIFVTLAIFYFSQIRRFYGPDISKGFQNGVSLLTLAATAFLMCAFTGRFIYPMLSLEGRKFWILGLLPLSRDRLLFGKFAFSASTLLPAAAAPIFFADWMLEMPGEVIAVHQATVAMLAVGLSGLSVGLGACLPNFRENDPSKIAVGFGGTLNLVAGLLLLVAVIALMAGPFHLLLWLHPESLHLPRLPWWTVGLFLLGMVLALGATVFPLRAGVRNLRRMEF